MRRRRAQPCLLSRSRDPPTSRTPVFGGHRGTVGSEDEATKVRCGIARRAPQQLDALSGNLFDRPCRVDRRNRPPFTFLEQAVDSQEMLDRLGRYGRTCVDGGNIRPTNRHDRCRVWAFVRTNTAHELDRQRVNAVIDLLGLLAVCGGNMLRLGGGDGCL